MSAGRTTNLTLNPSTGRARAILEETLWPVPQHCKSRLQVGMYLCRVRAARTRQLGPTNGGVVFRPPGVGSERLDEINVGLGLYAERSPSHPQRSGRSRRQACTNAKVRTSIGKQG